MNARLPNNVFVPDLGVFELSYFALSAGPFGSWKTRQVSVDGMLPNRRSGLTKR
jgi:hypothetical protein